ncbi:MAG: TIGR02996 domain-containing protein [Myxococcales bacterium]|nr:TIGR02996 domain-containing protein [Myxococcales bacterium]
MTDRGALLDAVLRDFDDVQARSVYADWLQERGDPRGELISLELRWACGSCAATEVRRIKHLRHALVAAVRQRFDNKRMALEIERGFVVAVDAQVSWLLERGAELFACEPVRYVVVRGTSPDALARLGEIAGIERVQWLWLSTASPQLLGAIKLPSLSLRITPRFKGLPALLDLPQMRRGFTPWSGYSVESLAAAAAEPALRNIEWLALHDDHLVVAELLASLPWRLRHLDISQRRLSLDALAALADNPTFSALRRIDLAGSDLDRRGAEQLVRGRFQLAHIDVSKCAKLSTDALDVLRGRFGDDAVVTDPGMLSSTIPKSK